MAVLTKHARRRLCRRVGINPSLHKTHIRLVLKHGHGYLDLQGPRKRYVNRIYKRGYYKADNIRIYNEFVYVFSKEVLLTVWPLPESLSKEEQVDGEVSVCGV